MTTDTIPANAGGLPKSPYDLAASDQREFELHRMAAGIVEGLPIDQDEALRVLRTHTPRTAG